MNKGDRVRSLRRLRYLSGTVDSYAIGTVVSVTPHRTTHTAFQMVTTMVQVAWDGGLVTWAMLPDIAIHTALDQIIDAMSVDQ